MNVSLCASSYDTKIYVYDENLALVACNDKTAIGAMQALQGVGLLVPEDISVIGFDDIDMARYTVPPLTTVRQGGVEMGRAAVDLLLRMAEDEIDQARRVQEEIEIWEASAEIMREACRTLLLPEATPG